MSETKFDPYDKLRKPLPLKPGSVIPGIRYDKTRMRRKEKQIIEEGLQEYQEYQKEEENHG